MRRSLFGILAAAGIGLLVSAANADPTVHYYITTSNATPTGGTWQVYADVSHDNDGLAYFNIDVLGGGGLAVTSSAQLMAPHPLDPSSQYNDGIGGFMGFNLEVSSGTLSGGNRLGIVARQSATEVTDDPTKDMGMLVGVGQEASSASPQNGTQGPIDGSGTPTGLTDPIWGYQSLANLPGGGGLVFPVAGTLIEQGSYSIIGTGSLTVADHLNLDQTQVLGTGQAIRQGGLNYPGFYPSGDNVPFGADPYQLGNVPSAIVTGDTIQVPEPASLGIISLIAIGLLNAGRHKRSQ